MIFQQRKDHIKQTIKGAFDITYRDIEVKNKHYFICFLNSLTDSKLMNELIKGLYMGEADLQMLAMYPAPIVKSDDLEQAITFLLSGQCVLLYKDDMYLIEVRNYPNQTSNEASNEQSIRGSHDSFVENIILNVGLIRRRIRDPRLRICLHQEGIKSKTDIAYIYMEDIIDPMLLEDFKYRLQHMKTTEVIYERTLCDALYGKSLNPYPAIRYCERPDICSIHLLQGYLVVLVDNSFTALILPTTFFEMTKQIEEYTQTSSVAFLIRIIRLLAIALSLYILPFWILIQYLQVPTLLNIPVVEPVKPFLLTFQILFVEMLIEWIRLSFIHTPKSISGVLGFLFIFLLGESAIKLNLYTEIVLVLVVLCNICNFVTPNYELSLANKCFRLFLSLSTIFFGLTGFSVSILIHFLVLLYTKTIHFSYLYPIIPFDRKELKRLLLGAPIKIKK